MGGINEYLWIILEIWWINRKIESQKLYIYILPNGCIWKKNAETYVFDFHWFYPIGILKVPCQWVGRQCSLGGHQPCQALGRKSTFLTSRRQWGPLPKDSSCPLRVEMQESSLDKGPSRCSMFALPDEVWLCALLLEIAWIQELGDVIQGNTPKIHLK